MDIKITYPPIEKRVLKRKKALTIIKWLILFAAVICLFVNIETGGRAWSLIVLVSLYMIWTLILFRSMVEYNRISQFIKFVLCLGVLLMAIDTALFPVIPIIFGSGLIISGILFFTDLEKQKKNMFPMLLLIIVTAIVAIIACCLCSGLVRTAFLVMGYCSAILLVICIVTLKSDFIRQLRCRFHVK